MQARVFILVPVLLGLTSCKEGVLDPRGPVGAAERLILFDATTVMLAVVVPVILLTLAFAWWFRAGNRRARYLPDFEYSGRIEMITWSIPALLICYLGGVAWIGSHRLHPSDPLDSPVPAIEVNVISLDWRWLFIYPAQGIASLNSLTVPVGVPVHFRITSESVMNSFFIPQLGSQIYSMPGMTTQLYLQADHPGTYQGLSAQFSGDGFSDMRFNVDAVSAAQFASWVEATKTRGGTLDAPAYAALALPAHAQGVTTFAVVDDGLFDRVSSGHRASQTHGDH
ncbi:MAG: ubiquinol oxidase subunit II [Pseudomonadota bacterium]